MVSPGAGAPPSSATDAASLMSTSSESADFDRFTDLRDDASAASPSSSSSSAPVDRGTAQFDFRHGAMPAGVTVIGDAELQVQADKSTALVLSPGAYLRLALPFTANGAIKATRVNDYSLTMDIKSQSPASFGADGLSLYQTRWDVNTAAGTEGEAYVSKGGGVGAFGEYGQSTTWMKPGKWHRVVLTVGGAWNNRRFASFINARPSVNITKGVFNSMDGRFSLAADSVTLFASTKPSLMPGVIVRFVEVKNATLSKEQVLEQATANRVFSYWEKEEAEVKAARYASLSLAPLYKKPPPVWIHPAFLGQMGDAFLEGTGLDSGDVAPSIAVLSLVFAQLRQQADAVEGLMADDDWAVVDAVSEVLKEAKELSRRFTLARKSPAQLVAFMKFFRAKLEALKEGDTMIVSAGIDAHPVMLTVERVSSASYRLTITNTHPQAGLQYHLVSAASPPKLKYRTSLVFEPVPAGRLLDDAWWGLVFKLVVIPSKANRPDKLYDLLLPHLVDFPLDAVLAAQGDEAEWRSPQRASTAYYKCLIDSVVYMMRRRGMARDRCKLVAFMVRLELMSMVDNDLQFVNGLSESDRRVIQMGCQQLAYAGLKIHNKAAGQLALSTAQLEALHEKLLMIDAVALSLPSTDVASAASPSLLHLDLPTPPQSSAFPLCDRLQRKEDVEGLAGLPVRLPAYVPVDVLQQPPRARDFEEALAAIRHCDRECTRIAVQGHCIKNQPQLIVSIIAHTFTHVVPVPLPQSSPQYAGSVWSTPLPYGLQLDVLILLQRIVEHFAASAFSLQPTRSFDAVRVLVPAVLLSIADVVLRKVATDIPSEVSLNLAGHPLSLPPFGVGLGRFVEQSEAMLLHTPELSVARTSVLDYFASLGVADDRLMFQWERFLAPEQSTGEWMGQICEQLAFPQGDIALYLSGEQHLIIKNYPEFPCYRDVAFFFKLFMNTEVEGFPPVAPWTQKHAGLKWKYDEGVYLVAGFQMELVCKPRKGPFTHRYPSPAVPGLLTTPHPAETEDDVLHIKTLPTFDDSLGQRDSELFLSYLTVPYMRLPLCLTFFATEDRIHALRSEKLREVLDSVLFEPGSYLAVGAATLPTLVPCNNPHLLATPYGHLVNEVYRSPDTTVTCTLRLLRLAQDLDVGTVRSSTVEIILYVVRLACRVENYLSYLVDREGDAHASVMRERRLTGELLRVCEEGLALIRRELRGGVHRMVEAWCDEAMKEIDMSVEANLKRSDDKKMDANTQLACTMHAHLLLVYHNVSARALNENVASQLLSSYIFLTTRHTFNLTLLPVDEHELFECLSVQRRVLVSYLRSCSQGALNRALESAVRTSTGTGVRRAQGGERKWGYVGGVHSGARFAVVSHRKRDERASDDDNAAVQTITATESMGVEIDLSLAQMTLRSSHLKALDTAIASNEDVLEVFGASSMQAATLQSAEHREWVRLVGRSCDLQYWKTPDARPDPQVFDREYQPGELEESEQWIVPLLEPVRLTYMTRPFVLQIVLPELPLSPHAEVAVLIGLHPKRGGNWKAIYVFKSLRTVHVYNVYSHGRRFYQSLEYTTDVRFTLRGMQPSVKDRQNPWPAWERHGAGHPYAEHEDPLSVVILRAADVHENASNTEETFIPSRLLYGIVPSALLDTHRFWQDTHDNLRGYPKDSDGHMLVVELEEKKSDQAALRTAGVVAHIRRLPLVKPGAAPRAQQTEEKEKARYRDEEKTKHRSDEEENGDDVEASPVKQARTLDEEELVLLNLLYAAPDSQLASLARTISRVENLSHVLAWAKASNVRWRGLELEGDVTVELLELPRLKLNFQSRKDEKGVTRLYSLDHVTLFVSNERSALTSKLISGLPHSLLLANANGEVMVLVPSIHPVRPIIGTAPFSTELVLNRVNKEWNTAVQDVRYHLYPVHVSLSFMFTPSLSSALYLLLLRFLHRDYAEVFRLANSIGTDTELSVEERAIFSALKDNADAHPDAHACRLKISLVTADSPMKPGWDVTHTMSRYISKLSHVSAHCRMTHAEELQLTQDCILSLSDPRFDPETMKEFDIVLVGNRASYLTALLAGQTSCAVTVPGRAIGGRWTHHVDLSYVAASPLDWQSLTVQFSASPVLSGVIALETANQFFTGLETMNGSALKLGFLFFYGLLTGTIKMKMAANDDSATFATLLLQLCMDAHDPGLLPSILHVLSRNPALCATLPKYKDARQFKHETINGFSEDGSPSPIDELFSELIPSLQSLAPFLKQPPTSYPRSAPPAARCEVRPLVGREWIIPALSNFAQDERVLRPVDGAALGDDALSLTSAQVDVLVTRPLSELALERYVTFMSRTERGLADVSAQLPFDVGRHPQAQSEVARAMTSRLQDDMRTFAAQENTGKSAKLLHVLDADVAAIVRDPSSPVLATALSHVQLLLTSLQQLRDDDSAYVSNAIPWILSQANAVATEAEASEDDAGSTDRFRFLLRRYAGQESHLWLETIFAALLSSESVADMRKVNPFLDDRALADIFDVAVAVILRANRVGHANRSISDARDLLHLLHQAQHPSASLSSSALTAGLTQKAEMLARNLVTARHYIDRRPSGELVYDPRFLVFEFTWNLCLRKMQVELVRDFMRHVREGRSTVKGMLMGEGKTTVVGPLLALMLADGKRLVISCQPPALLEFSRSIQRSTFSAIMFKRIFTLTLERSSKVDAKLYSKLLNARQTGGIVISTPTAIKSIQLKFIELLAAIEDSTRPRHAQMEVEAAELHRTLRLFQSSVLIMDEVDLILHPLKSELNFPIGAKLDLDFAPHRWKLPIHLLDAVFFASRGRMSVGFHDSNRAHAILAQLAQLIQLGYSTRALQRNPHVVLLNVEFYHEQLKPVLMDWLLLWLESQHLSGLSEEQIKAYILHGSTGDVKLTAAVEALSPKMLKMLNLSRDWLGSYMPHVLSKIDRVSFGLLNADDLRRAKALDAFMPSSRAVLAVPFVGKDVPSRSSEFAHPDIIIGLTILAYRYEGLRESDFHDIIASLRSTLTKEIGPYQSRKSTVRYNRFVTAAGGRIRGQQVYRDEEDEQKATPDGRKQRDRRSSAGADDERVEVVALRLLKRSNEEQMRALYQLLRLLPDLIHWYLLEFIFPAEMRHQVTKLQASGQDLGGEMLFPVRLAFSGTPSTLLPYELGEAHFQPGSDGLIVHTLTDPAIVQCERIVEGWTVTSLLDAIATNPNVHALIDTGALITGMSNLDVARYLLQRGLTDFAGVVFLDELDRKMILVRSTGHVVPLATSGVPPEARFAFYDQIHTTGMDIQHRLNACAVLTLGKDMVFRDYAQGAYRMRGIAKGQTIRLFVIPEIVDLMGRELGAAAAEKARATAAGAKVVVSAGRERAQLEEIAAWLVINSMRSERIQFNALALQNLANVWRKTAFKALMDNVDAFNITEPLSSEQASLRRSLHLFNEPVLFAVESGVKEPRLFSATVQAAVEAHGDYILSEHDRAVVQRVQHAVAGVVDDDLASSFDREMVQEQEAEREQEQEQEQEQEVSRASHRTAEVMPPPKRGC